MPIYSTAPITKVSMKQVQSKGSTINVLIATTTKPTLSMINVRLINQACN